MLTRLSVVGLFGLGLTFPRKILDVVLLCVPSLAWGVWNIVAPSINLSEGNSILELSKLHVQAIKGILGSGGPAHQGRLVGTPIVHLNHPVIVHLLIGGVAVKMLALRHVNACNSVTHLLSLPGRHPPCRTRRSLHIVLGALINSDLLGVQVGVFAAELVGDNWLALDGTVNEFFSVGGVAARRGPDVMLELLLAQKGSFRLHYLYCLLDRLANHNY